MKRSVLTRLSRTRMAHLLYCRGRPVAKRLAQAARRAKIPVSSLSQAVTDGRVRALIMPDPRCHVAWSDVEQFVQHTRNGHAVKPHILLHLAALSNRPDSKDLPADFSTNHDRAIPDTLTCAGYKRSSQRDFQSAAICWLKLPV